MPLLGLLLPKPTLPIYTYNNIRSSRTNFTHYYLMHSIAYLILTELLQPLLTIEVNIFLYQFISYSMKMGIISDNSRIHTRKLLLNHVMVSSLITQTNNLLLIISSKRKPIAIS